MSRYGERPRSVRRVGLAGSNCVRFEVTVRHGKGERRIDVDIHARDILAMADAIRATANQACVPPRSRTGYPQDDLSVGHAIWHLDNPDRPMPCIVGDVIDVPAGDQPRLPGAPQASILLATGVDGQEDARSLGDAIRAEVHEASIHELVLSQSAMSCLVDAGVRTLGDLAKMTSAQVRALPGSSGLVVLTIWRALEQVGLTFLWPQKETAASDE